MINVDVYVVAGLFISMVSFITFHEIKKYVHEKFEQFKQTYIGYTVHAVYVGIMNLFLTETRQGIGLPQDILVGIGTFVLCLLGIGYYVVHLTVTPADGLMYRLHARLIDRVTGWYMSEWQATMRFFDREFHRIFKIPFQGLKFLMPKPTTVNNARTTSTFGTQKLAPSKRNKIFKGIGYFTIILLLILDTIMQVCFVYAPPIILSMKTYLLHLWIRMRGISITFGSVEEYYQTQAKEKSEEPQVTKENLNFKSEHDDDKVINNKPSMVRPVHYLRMSELEAMLQSIQSNKYRSNLQNERPIFYEKDLFADEPLGCKKDQYEGQPGLPKKIINSDANGPTKIPVFYEEDEQHPVIISHKVQKNEGPIFYG